MFERRLRLILTGAMSVTLLLPMNPPPDSEPNWIYILWYSIEAPLRAFRSTDIANCIGWLLFLLGLLSVPILILFNLCLAIRPFVELKMLYRILVPVLFLLTWHESLQFDSELQGVGFWANIAVVSAAALIEAVLVVREQLEKRKKTAM